MPAGALFEACRGAVVVDGGVVAVVVEEYILDGGDGIIALGSMMTGGVAAPDILDVEDMNNSIRWSWSLVAREILANNKCRAGK